ncbi:hypothetical protein, partial [Paracoccus fontiphilus]
MHDLGRSWNDLLQQMRAAIDLQKDVDARREALSFADMMPVVLVADPDRVDQRLLALPPFLRQRLLDRPFRLFQFTRPEKATMPAFLGDWQKKQFQKLGYATCVTAPSARGVLKLILARCRVLTCVRPHDAAFQMPQGPYGVRGSGSKSTPRARWLCCTNFVRNSSCESSLVAVMY